MKSVSELGVITGISVLAGLGNWVAGGKVSPDPVVELDQVPLKDGEIRLEDAMADGGEGVVWIDARPEAVWKKESKPGAINITMLSDEPLGDQIARHQDQLFGARRIIVFCDDVHCSVSHDLGERLKTEFRDFLGGEILILHGGMTALRGSGLVTNSNPGP